MTVVTLGELVLGVTSRCASALAITLYPAPNAACINDTRRRRQRRVSEQMEAEYMNEPQANFSAAMTSVEEARERFVADANKRILGDAEAG
jgi:hypothetical protein